MLEVPRVLIEILYWCDQVHLIVKMLRVPIEVLVLWLLVSRVLVLGILIPGVLVLGMFVLAILLPKVLTLWVLMLVVLLPSNTRECVCNHLESWKWGDIALNWRLKRRLADSYCAYGGCYIGQCPWQSTASGTMLLLVLFPADSNYTCVGSQMHIKICI